jgi:hypothetical protein
MGGVFSKPKAPTAPPPQPVSPTTAEVSQSAATDATGMYSASKKIKRKGRSATILTSSAGVEEVLS